MHRHAAVVAAALLAATGALAGGVPIGNTSAGGGAAPLTDCTQLVAEDFSTDPFVSRWTQHIESGGAGCTITWNSGDDTVSRNGAVAGTCTNNVGLIRNNTDMGTRDVATLQLIANATSGVNGSFELGGVEWSQDTPIDSAYYPVRCDDGEDCGTLAVGFSGFELDSCATMGAIPTNGYMGICTETVDSDTDVVRAFNFGTSQPGDPINSQCVGWGTPDCTLTIDGTGLPDPIGERFGIWMRSNSVTALAELRIATYDAWACTPQNKCVFDTEMPCVL